MRSTCQIRAQIRRVREFIRENPSNENKTKLKSLEKELRVAEGVDNTFRILCGFNPSNYKV